MKNCRSAKSFSKNINNHNYMNNQESKNPYQGFQKFLIILLGFALTLGGIILTSQTSILINLFIPILPVGLIILYIFLIPSK